MKSRSYRKLRFSEGTSSHCAGSLAAPGYHKCSLKVAVIDYLRALDIRSPKARYSRAVLPLKPPGKSLCQASLPAAGRALACGCVTPVLTGVLPVCGSLHPAFLFYEDSSHTGLGVHATLIGPHLN